MHVVLFRYIPPASGLFPYTSIEFDQLTVAIHWYCTHFRKIPVPNDGDDDATNFEWSREVVPFIVELFRQPGRMLEATGEFYSAFSLFPRMDGESFPAVNRLIPSIARDELSMLQLKYRKLLEILQRYPFEVYEESLRHLGERLQQVVEDESITSGITGVDSTLPLSVWPMVLERAWKRKYLVKSGVDAMHHLLWKTPALHDWIVKPQRDAKGEEANQKKRNRSDD